MEVSGTNPKPLGKSPERKLRSLDSLRHQHAKEVVKKGMVRDL